MRARSLEPSGSSRNSTDPTLVVIVGGAIPTESRSAEKWLRQPTWKSKPSWYIVGKNDRTVHPDMERFVAKRMGATTYELDSSHVPMLSQPNSVIDVIRAAAKSRSRGSSVELL